VQARLPDPILLIQQDGDLAVTLHAGYRLDHDFSYFSCRSHGFHSP